MGSIKLVLLGVGVLPYFFPSVAQLSTVFYNYVAFAELIHLEDLLFSTNQKPRKNLHTDELTN